MTTVSIRDRIAMRMPGAPAPNSPMSLLDAPVFLRDQFGLRSLEVWSLQFEDLSLDYCAQLRAAADKAGVGLSNVQVDDIGMDLASEDDAVRARSVKDCKAWVDRTVALGAPSVRLNLSAIYPPPTGPYPLDRAVASFRELAEYGKAHGIHILTENHAGHSLVIDNVVATLKAVDHPYFRTVFDWGNAPAPGIGGTPAVIERLERLVPWMYQVSARGVNFDADYRPTDYDPAAITRATEALGYEGLYSIELYAHAPPPGFDPVRAVKSMIDAVAPNLRKA
jgi:sugar phosphate isomerase/epimerase